jgi:tetratricopeptide (TPR) repeat protein
MQLIRKKSFHLILLAILPSLFYFNTLFNNYALDDSVVITENKLTKKGIAAIPELVSHNLYHGYVKIKVGLYRPLPLLTHALEYQFFGRSPAMSHLINLILYALVIFLLYKLLSDYLFIENSLAAFLSSLLFAIHPIHTEAVANIKGRDELLSLLFLLSSLIFLFRFISSSENKYLILSLSLYFLALLSKENGITFLLIIPLFLWFFTSKKSAEIFKLFSFFAVAAGIYLFLKFYITGFTTNDEEFILNTPFLYASSTEAFATKIFVQLKYILLLFFPYPLSYDYCYNQIPYADLTDPRFIASALIISALLAFAILRFRKRNIVSFGILFYFISISIVSNFVFGIGAPMGERFLFQASIGFSMIVGYLMTEFIQKTSFYSESFRTGMTIFLLTVLVLVCGYITIERNKDWKDNKTLFMADVYSAPNSIRTNTNAATTEYFDLLPLAKDQAQRKMLTEDAISKYRKTIAIDSSFPDPYTNLLIIYVQENNLPEAENIFLKGRKQGLRSAKFNNSAPIIRDAWNRTGHAWYQKKNLDSALFCFRHAAFIDPTSSEAYYNMGGIYLEKGQGEKTVELWTKVMSLDPTNAKVKELLPKVKKDFGISN